MAGKLANVLMGLGYSALGVGMILKVKDALSGADDDLPAPAPSERQGETDPEFGRLVFGRPANQRRLPAPKGRAVEGGSIENRLKMIAELVRKGGKTAAIHEQAKKILTQKCPDRSRPGRETWCVPPKDWRAEVLAIHRAVCDPNEEAAARYVRDMLRADTFSGAHRTAFVTHGEDCLPGGTLLLTPGGFVPIEEIRPGAVIMGDGGWTRVTSWWDKGIQDLVALKLNNGSTLRCTAEHRLFRVPRHGGGRPGTRGEAAELRAGEVEIGDHLLTPERLPFGAESLGVDRGWLLGVFAADGWRSRDARSGAWEARASIAGKDGHPKEAQKRRVAEIGERLGFRTSWSERWISILDEGMANFLGACGHGALNKHIPSMDLDEESVRAVLEGLTADAGVHKGSLVYSTTSRELALQLRVFHRMLGERVNIRRVDEHGGLGENPIYRVSLIRAERIDGRRPNPYAIVQDVQESVAAPVYDIETESGRFYLPEHDLVVHNCDGLTILEGALLESVGHPVRLRVVAANGKGSWSHIYLLTGLPPEKPDEWIPLDPSMPEKPAGWQAEGAADVARSGKRASDGRALGTGQSPAGIVSRVLDYSV